MDGHPTTMLHTTHLCGMSDSTSPRCLTACEADVAERQGGAMRQCVLRHISIVQCTVELDVVPVKVVKKGYFSSR